MQRTRNDQLGLSHPGLVGESAVHLADAPALVDRALAHLEGEA